MSRLRIGPILPALFAFLLAVPAPAAPDDADTLRPRGGVLRIPGFPPVQLPPGARAFTPTGPGVVDEPEPPPAGGKAAKPDAGADKPAAERRPDRIAPHSVPTVESQRAKALDSLFARLKTAEDPEDAKDVAEAIQRVWLRSGSDTADLLMGRAVAAIAAKDLKTAETLLDSVIEIEPDWAEGWNKRASVRFFADDIDGAMADIDRALKMEPRHFGALTGLAAILQKAGLEKRALEAYRRALAIYPQQPDIRKAVEKLQLEVEGRDI